MYLSTIKGCIGRYFGQCFGFYSGSPRFYQHLLLEKKDFYVRGIGRRGHSLPTIPGLAAEGYGSIGNSIDFRTCWLQDFCDRIILWQQLYNLLLKSSSVRYPCNPTQRNETGNRKTLKDIQQLDKSSPRTLRNACRPLFSGAKISRKPATFEGTSRVEDAWFVKDSCAYSRTQF